MPEQSEHPEFKLWDEITKAISFHMTPRLLPVLQEAYGKVYPPGTSIQLLSTEHSTYFEDPAGSLSSKLMDIAVLVAGTDYYHIESQMDNDRHMVIRMVAYDFHFAVLHDTTRNEDTGEYILHFPHSVVIYPEKNSTVPHRLRCQLIFPDGSHHVYQIPTLRIQTYSLEDIAQKHLDFFIPFSLLRFRPRLKSLRDSLSAEELTEFVKRLILILQNEVAEGILTQLECNDYINLLNKASAHIFKKCPAHHEEVLKVTEPMIKLPSVEMRELRETLAQNETALSQKDAIIARDKAYIAELEQKLAALQA